MSYCEIHQRKSSKDMNNGTFSNYWKTPMPSGKKLNGQTRKKLRNQHVFFHPESHHMKPSNDCKKPAQNCSQNLKNKHVSPNFHDSIKSEPCKTHKKNKKSSAVYKYKLNCEQCACLACKNGCIEEKHFANSTETSEEATELKNSTSDTNHCLNNTATATAEAEQSKSSVPHTDCKYCHCHTNSEKIPKAKSSIPHTDCKYCRNNTNNIEGVLKSKKSLPHTDCKYCRNNINNEGEAKSKNLLPHTDCKYCLDNISKLEESTESDISSASTNSISLEEELSDELLNLYSITGHRYNPCTLHDPYPLLDPLYLHSPYYQIHHKRPSSYTCSLCEYPEFCLVNNDTTSHIREYLTDRYPQSLQELDIQNNMDKSLKFKPCEFCIRNGETPVIYNSHQLRNTFGTITCPILRQYNCHDCEIVGNRESCRRNYNEIIAAMNRIHAHNSIPHVGLPFKETMNGCASCSLLGLQGVSPSDLYSSQSSLEIPRSYSFRNKSNLRGNRRFCTDFNDCSTEKHHDRKCAPNFNNQSLPTHNHDIKSSILKYYQNYTSQLRQRNNSANKHKPKKSVSCQFCLTTGKPPYIYNSHELRDESGANLNCPILKEQVNEATGSIAHACSGSLCNIFDEEMRFPVTQRISNGSLSKCQYFDLTDCLV